MVVQNLNPQVLVDVGSNKVILKAWTDKGYGLEIYVPIKESNTPSEVG